jgi:hypothetical protein
MKKLLSIFFMVIFLISCTNIKNNNDSVIIDNTQDFIENSTGDTSMETENNS